MWQHAITSLNSAQERALLGALIFNSLRELHYVKISKFHPHDLEFVAIGRQLPSPVKY